MPPTNPPPASDATPTPGAGDELGRHYCGNLEPASRFAPNAKVVSEIGVRVAILSATRDLVAERDALRGELEYMKQQRDAMFEKAMRYDREVGQLKHERDALRAAVEEMRLIVDAAKAWGDSDMSDPEGVCTAELKLADALSRAALARGPAAGETGRGWEWRGLPPWALVKAMEGLGAA
jgi:hypothetical protein